MLFYHNLLYPRLTACNKHLYRSHKLLTVHSIPIILYHYYTITHVPRSVTGGLMGGYHSRVLGEAIPIPVYAPVLITPPPPRTCTHTHTDTYLFLHYPTLRHTPAPFPPVRSHPLCGCDLGVSNM